MNLEEMKSNWDVPAADQKLSTNDILLMTKTRNHPKLKWIRIKLLIECLLLIGFLFIYNDIFDGLAKAVWLNYLVITSACLFIIGDCISLLVLYNPVSGDNLRNSLKHFHLNLKRIALFSISTSVLFGSSIILFFTFGIHFTQTKMLLLLGLLIGMIVLIYLSTKNWIRKINHIKKSEQAFNARMD
ncbi:MAG: hypothetical protein FH748_15340 [Balneolaceae bacterium]|nr:hypothetical protein [Balneolaceae bacterium]